MKELYKYLDKRKSIRKIDKNNLINDDDLKKIKLLIDDLVPLFKEYIVRCELVKSDQTTSKIGEYNLLIYSTKPNSKNTNHLLNIGYMFEQLDLKLASINIGCCWLGLPKPKSNYKNDEYIIMLGLSKIKEEDLRKSKDEFNRKKISDIWDGSFNEDVIYKASLAPSACNSQSWKVKIENNNLLVYRDKNVKTIIPRSFRSFFNSIDLGIYLCFLEIALIYNNIKFDREIINNEMDKESLILIARYKIYE